MDRTGRGSGRQGVVVCCAITVCIIIIICTRRAYTYIILLYYHETRTVNNERATDMRHGSGWVVGGVETAVGVVRTGWDDGWPGRVYAEYDQGGTSNYTGCNEDK